MAGARGKAAGTSAKRRRTATRRAPASPVPVNPHFTHFDPAGQAHMVDIAGKDVTKRVARAGGRIVMRPATLALIRAGTATKGDVLGVARVAAIQAAKRTSDLLPLCHPLALTRVAVTFDPDVAASAVAIEVTAETLGQTGVEMEALTAATVGLLTIYDMCKAVDRGMRIEGVRVLEKVGRQVGSLQGRVTPRRLHLRVRAQVCPDQSGAPNPARPAFGPVVGPLDRMARAAVESVSHRAVAARATVRDARLRRRRCQEGSDVPLQTVESTRLYRQIAEQISTLIDRREFPAGSRLPAERELAVLLGVSRTSVREAIIALELAGRVEVRVGTGIFVTGPGLRRKRDGSAGPVDDDGPGPFELLAARAMIEGEIAALAARNARKSDIVALRETIARMHEHSEDFVERDAADRSFHVLHCRVDAQRRAAARSGEPVGPATRRSVDADRNTLPYTGASSEDADRPRIDRRRARSPRCRRGARGNAPPPATRCARIPATLGRDRRRQQIRGCPPHRARPRQEVDPATRHEAHSPRRSSIMKRLTRIAAALAAATLCLPATAK